jgi:putative tricarboxylic transport membrane protein
MRLGDLLSGVLFVVLGLAVLAYARSLPQVPGHFYGPGLFPAIIGWGFTIGGGLLALSALRALVGSGVRLRLFSAPDWPIGPGRLLQVGLLFATILAFVALGEYLGFAAIAFLALVSMYVAAGRGIVLALVLATGVTAGLQLLFGKLLGVPLPPGEVWSFLR